MDNDPNGWPKIGEKGFRALIQAHLASILRSGRDRTQAVDVHQMQPETGYSREYVRLELARLCHGPHTDADAFRLRRDENDRLGVYEILPPADTEGRDITRGRRKDPMTRIYRVTVAAGPGGETLFELAGSADLINEIVPGVLERMTRGRR